MVEKIAHITDLHLDEDFPFNDCKSARKRFDRILLDIDKKDISHVVCTGDIGENKGIQYFFDQLKSKSLLLTLGNHDVFSEISKHYTIGTNDHSQKLYYSILKKHHKYIYLDSSQGIIDQVQLLWLKKELISAKSIIVFIHHPIIGLNLKVDEIGKLKNREAIISLLTESTRAITIYCGHYHMESTMTYKNITQYITPAIAFQIRKHPSTIEIDTSFSGYRIIEIQNENIFSSVQLLSNAD